MKREATIRDSVNAFPGFPVVLVTTRDNIITVGLVHRFSYNPFMLGIGISHRRYSYQLIKEGKGICREYPYYRSSGAGEDMRKSVWTGCG